MMPYNVYIFVHHYGCPKSMMGYNLSSQLQMFLCMYVEEFQGGKPIVVYYGTFQQGGGGGGGRMPPAPPPLNAPLTTIILHVYVFVSPTLSPPTTYNSSIYMYIYHYTCMIIIYLHCLWYRRSLEGAKLYISLCRNSAYIHIHIHVRTHTCTNTY